MKSVVICEVEPCKGNDEFERLKRQTDIADRYQKTLESLFRDGKAALFGAKFGEEYVGRVTLRYSWSDDSPRDGQSVRIEDEFTSLPQINALIVNENHRNRGVATQLMEAVEKEASSRGFDKVGLGVEISNVPALKLYEKLGYEYQKVTGKDTYTIWFGDPDPKEYECFLMTKVVRGASPDAGNVVAKRIILLHGKDKNSSDVWYPWVGEVAKRLGCNFIAPDLPSSSEPVLSEWLNIINKLDLSASDIVVGHSRGAMAILRYLEKFDRRVRSVILVAGNNPEIPDGFDDTFYESGQFDFRVIKNRADRFIVLHSLDDSWVPYEAGRINATNLGAELVTVDGKGHFGQDSEGSTQTSICELEEILIREINYTGMRASKQEVRND